MNELGIIDLRSDTVTHPTTAMRQAMFEAVVGDDVYHDDPATNELEAEAARILGMEAALFVPSGTMGNQLGVLVHTQRGQEIVLGSEAHIFVHEVGGAAVIAGVSMKTVSFEGLLPDPDRIESAIRPEDIHQPETGLICLENALSNGKVVPQETMKAVHEIAKRHNLPVHLDGARIFNSAVALGIDVRDITQYVDTVNVCVSKGLCAPIGSIFAGRKETVTRARKWRKLLGGGMRQTGFMAAPALIAIRDMPWRLHEDHENARYMAEKLAAIDQVKVKSDRLDINMVFFTIEREKELLDKLPDLFAEDNIMINELEDGEWRWVAHIDIDKTDIDKAVEKLNTVLKFN
ncbi:MAG TPA: low-specificity L-threonine aldolase [Clostridiaceae bacterium]|nr:low-specificity L-threonine aldolase [Clostridiaceae bacterium]